MCSSSSFIDCGIRGALSASCYTFRSPTRVEMPRDTCPVLFSKISGISGLVICLVYPGARIAKGARVLLQQLHRLRAREVLGFGIEGGFPGVQGRLSRQWWTFGALIIGVKMPRCLFVRGWCEAGHPLPRNLSTYTTANLLF